MLERIDHGIWHAEDDLFMPGKIHFRVRMTVIQLEGNRLMLISPISMKPALAEAIEKLGKVTWIVAPNAFHHLFIRESLERWPEAELWGPSALHKKRKRLSFTGTLNGNVPQAWEKDLELQWIQGAPRMDEVVFFHKPSQTLIVTDLVFHINRYKTKRTAIMLRMAGVHKRFAQSRLWRFLLVKNRSKVAQSVASIFRWDFQRVVMAHGDILEENVRAQMAQALEWMLNKEKLPIAS